MVGWMWCSFIDVCSCNWYVWCLVRDIGWLNYTLSHHHQPHSSDCGHSTSLTYINQLLSGYFTFYIDLYQPVTVWIFYILHWLISTIYCLDILHFTLDAWPTPWYMSWYRDDVQELCLFKRRSSHVWWRQFLTGHLSSSVRFDKEPSTVT